MGYNILKYMSYKLYFIVGNCRSNALYIIGEYTLQCHKPSFRL